MNTSKVVVIDYGIGNLLSVRRGLEYCGASVTVTADPEIILSAAHVVLPGVGAFADGMSELRSRRLDVVVRDVVNRGTPLLGICLGMQMLFDESEEFGTTTGLGLIPGRVIPVPFVNSTGVPHKIPHIGWNALVHSDGCNGWEKTPLQSVKPGEEVYFVHSFMASSSYSEHCIANCVYGGVNITAAVRRENVFGCQFHPEKSGEVGLKILRSFLS